MPPEPTTLTPPALRLVPRRALRVVDVALSRGEHTYGMRAYLEAKRAFARETDRIEHHLLGPEEAGPRGRDLLPALEALAPDLVLLHDPLWRAREVCRLVHLMGGTTVMVHHGAAALQARASARSGTFYERALRAWLHRTYDEADAVMAAGDPWEDTGRSAAMRLRFGLHPDFRPQPGVPRGDHVLYAGRVAREKGILTLIDALAFARDEDWRVRVLGDGPALGLLRGRARELGLTDRVELLPFVDDRRALAREYAAARCVVMPGPRETFGLVAFEAAACGTPVVAADTAPSAQLIGRLAHVFRAGDHGDLLRAVRRARRAERDDRAGARLGEAHAWRDVFERELRELEALVRW